MDALLRYDSDDWAPFTPAADTNPGTIVQLADGRAGLVQGGNKIAADTEGTVRTRGIVEVETDGAIAIADGATVGWDEATGKAVVTGDVAKDYDIGKARRGGVTAGSSKLYVALNAHITG